MVLIESTTFETYYRLRKTWKFAYYYFAFLHIFKYFAYIFVYISHIFAYFVVLQYKILLNYILPIQIDVLNLKQMFFVLYNSKVKIRSFNFTDSIKNMLTFYNSIFHFIFLNSQQKFVIVSYSLLIANNYLLPNTLTTSDCVFNFAFYWIFKLIYLV